MVGECGTNMAMRDRPPRSRERRVRPPLDETALRDLALSYVARFATSRAKLGQYLRRKLNERGWAGEREAPVTAIVEKLAEAGYIDDPAYALPRRAPSVLVAMASGASRSNCAPQGSKRMTAPPRVT